APGGRGRRRLPRKRGRASGEAGVPRASQAARGSAPSPAVRGPADERRRGLPDRARTASLTMHVADENMASGAHEPSVASLLTGIVVDIQALAQQETALATQQLREELGNILAAVVKTGTAVLVGAIGVWLIAFGAALAIPGVLAWPLWAGFVAAGVAATLVSAIALLAMARGRRKEVPEWKRRRNGYAAR